MNKALPAWLEPYREQLTQFVRILDKWGFDLSDPQLHRVHIRLQEIGVKRRVWLVSKAGHDTPKNRARLDRTKRKRFWEIVKAWQDLLREERLAKSDRLKK